MRTPHSQRKSSHGIGSGPMPFSPQLAQCLGSHSDGHLNFQVQGTPSPAKVLAKAPLLKGYFFDRDVELACVEHNRRWASGLESHPRFLFAYLSLPTSCSLRCKGCFQGQDRKNRAVKPWKKTFLADRLDEILDYLKARGGSSIAYAGIGELMDDPQSLEFIERIRSKGLNFVMFTNGQRLADFKLANRLNDLGVTVILSFRDPDEEIHDLRTGKKGSFRNTLAALDNCLSLGLRSDNRLAVEMPVLRNNKARALQMLAAARQLDIVPLLESYVVVGLPEEYIEESLDFEETDSFFKEMSAFDRSLGYDTHAEWGQRIVGRPPCRRPNFTFTIEHDQRVLGCPASKKMIGTLKNHSVCEAVESDLLRRELSKLELCPCSTFVGLNRNNIPHWLPRELLTLT